MSPIKSLDELRKAREQALEKRQLRSGEAKAQISVAMGTCGIAAGARETMKSILTYVESNDLSGIIITQTGCIGLCEHEPIVQVRVGDGSQVTYGKVTPQVAERIMKEHVAHGHPVSDFVISN
jgi:NADP-reducing hydrogenase subunit HndB